MKKILLFTLVIGLPALACRSDELPPSARPNIILILADDMGYGDVAGYYPRSKVRTPYLDSLMRSGLSFFDAHSGSAVCSPTRYGILTGRYAWRSRLKKGVLRPYDPPLMDPAQVTLPDLLKQAGYTTACVGKWHLGWDWPLQHGGVLRDSIHLLPPGGRRIAASEAIIDYAKPLLNGPIAHGFDHYFGDDVPNYPPYAFISDDRLTTIPNEQKPDDMFGTPGLMTEDWQLDAVMPAITRHAVDYIEKTSQTNDPFFLYFPLTAPHTPIAPAPAWRGSSDAGAYGDYVQQVDATVGAILEAVSRAGIRENTMIIFSSDNGSPARNGQNMNGAHFSVHRTGHYPNAEWRGIKSDIWEGGHRVPLIISWPGHIRKDSVHHIVCLNDIMATLAGVLTLNLPKGSAEDSRSFQQVLFNAYAAPGRESVVHHSIDGTFAIRKGDWKLILSAGSGGWSMPGRSLRNRDDLPPMQLYNLAQDPGEVQNKAAEYPELVQSLLQLLREVQSQERIAGIGE